MGVMFGRYSLDVDGLVYAGGEWDASKYVSFPADKDNIIPICDDKYFEDDIVGLEQRIANASTGERVKLNKKLTALQDQDTENRIYEEKIHHLADQMIFINLDGGVKKNYAIFQDVLAKIK